MNHSMARHRTALALQPGVNHLLSLPFGNSITLYLVPHLNYPHDLQHHVQHLLRTPDLFSL